MTDSLADYDAQIFEIGVLILGLALQPILSKIMLFQTHRHVCKIAAEITG